MPLLPEEEAMFDPTKGERAACRCLRKMMAGGAEQIEAGQVIIQKMNEAVSKQKDINPDKPLPPQILMQKKLIEDGVAGAMAYQARIVQEYEELGCREERISLLRQRVKLIQKLEDEGEASAQQVGEKMRYLNEIGKLKATGATGGT